MAKFAQYYLKYNLDNLFAFEHKNERQTLFGNYFKENDSIEFSLGEGEDKTIFKHQVYHLSLNKDIIVMQIANDKNKTVEQDFKEVLVKHEPSCYVIIDNRENCWRIAIQKNKNVFNSTNSLRHIIAKCINDRMLAENSIGIELNPQYYPKDFYKAWRLHQHHTARLRFNISEADLPKDFDASEWDDDGIIGFAIKTNEEVYRRKYRTVLELNPPSNIAYLPIDEDSNYIKNLVSFSAKTGSRIEIVTSDGAIFNCYIGDEEESDRIVCNELDANVLEALFCKQTEERENAEIQVLEFVNGMKYVVDGDENKEDAA
jgi:hypothetical protein